MDPAGKNRSGSSFAHWARESQGVGDQSVMANWGSRGARHSFDHAAGRPKKVKETGENRIRLAREIHYVAETIHDGTERDPSAASLIHFLETGSQ